MSEATAAPKHLADAPDAPAPAAPTEALSPAVAPPAATAEAPAALIVFGLDDGGKPHASRFAEADAELAMKAAGLMGMRTLAIETDEHRALAAQVPQGRVFASGKGFVPFVKRGLYDGLIALAGPAPVTAPGGNARPGKAAPAETKPTDAKLAKASAQRPGGNVSKATEVRPVNWDGIAVGATVLVHGGGEDGWFEANVVEVKTANLLVLRWRDWPELPVLVRTRADIALMNPAPVAAQA